jgi:transcriptional regulator with XRE-family HTH domain
MVGIGKRLRELRKAKGLSQGDVEDRTGLPQAHVSKIENGLSTPTIPVLERWANALDVDLYQLFAVGYGQPEAAESPERIPVGAQGRTLLGLFGQMPVRDKSLLISLAREMVKRVGQGE